MNSMSLSAYCKRHNLPKASVYKFLKAEGFDTANGMTAEAIAATAAYFLDVPHSTDDRGTGRGEAITPEIITGNHRGALALPTPPAQIDLGQYRGEYAALTSFEPTDIERFLNSCDGFLEAVEQDYKHQRAITQQKEAVAAQVKAKVEAVKEASLVYQLRSEQLALHNATLDQALQRDMSTLGKPQQPAEPPHP